MASADEPTDLVGLEFERVGHLLAGSKIEMELVDSTEEPEVAGALHRWVMRAPGACEADIYLCADFEGAQLVSEHLFATEPSPDDDGLPAVGQNGRLVYVVRNLDTSGSRDAVYDTLDVAGALGGDEG